VGLGQGVDRARSRPGAYHAPMGPKPKVVVAREHLTKAGQEAVAIAERAETAEGGEEAS
jgi:hypothetical protein